MDQAENLRNIIKCNAPRKNIARVITVTSGKGGVGKSSISLNLGLHLQRQGKRVIILDADFGLANVEVMLGIRPKYSLADLIYKGKNISDIITYGPEGLGFISGGSGINELVDLKKEQIAFLISRLLELDELADVIIVDTGAGISDSVLQFVLASQEVLLIATPEPTSITDAYALLKTLNRQAEFIPENVVIKLIANRVRSREEGKEIFNKLSVVAERFLDIRLEYLGFVPFDMNVSDAVISQKPVSLVFPNSKSTKALFDLASSLVEEAHVDKKPAKGITQLFSNILHLK